MLHLFHCALQLISLLSCNTQLFSLDQQLRSHVFHSQKKVRIMLPFFSEARLNLLYLSRESD